MRTERFWDSVEDEWIYRDVCENIDDCIEVWMGILPAVFGVMVMIGTLQHLNLGSELKKGVKP